MKSYKITHTSTIVIVAKDKEQALKDAYSQEFRAIDLIEFSVGAKIIEDR